MAEFFFGLRRNKQDKDRKMSCFVVEAVFLLFELARTGDEAKSVLREANIFEGDWWLFSFFSDLPNEELCQFFVVGLVVVDTDLECILIGLL